MTKKRKKICMLSSCGGHFMEMMQLLPAVKDFDFYIVTEKNYSTESIVKSYRHHYLMQQQRNGYSFIFKFAYNIVLSFVFLLKEWPRVIVTTGAGAAYPTCLFAKWFGIKVIYIESFAKLSNSSLTGKLIHRFADRFYVQWPEMKSVYPNAIYYGKVY